MTIFENRNLNPNGDEMGRLISEMMQKVSNLERPRQTLQGDWTPINVSKIANSGTINEYITSTENNFINYLTPGRKVRWKVTGDANYKYGITYDINASYTRIAGKTLS